MVLKYGDVRSIAEDRPIGALKRHILVIVQNSDLVLLYWHPSVSFELILSSEHAIDRSAHLFQNKSRRHATHHFELIRLTWTNFKSIGLHSFDGDFNHVFHLHDRNAFHVFRIRITQEFGLCRRWR